MEYTFQNDSPRNSQTDHVAEPSKTSQESLAPLPAILKRQAMVLEDLVAEPSKPSEKTSVPQPTIVNRQAEVFDDIQQPRSTVIKRPATTLLDSLLSTPPVPAQQTPILTGASISPITSAMYSSTKPKILPPAPIYDSSGARIIGGHPTGEKIQLHSPPLSPEELRNPLRTTRYGKLVRPGGLFNDVVAGPSVEEKKESTAAVIATTTGAFATPEPAKEGGKSANMMGASEGMFNKNQGMFGKGMFTIPMPASLISSSITLEEKEPRRTSQSSRSSNQHTTFMSSPPDDAVSRPQISATVDSNSSDRAQSSTLSKMLTISPPPLLSGYDHVVPTSADSLSIDEDLQCGAEERPQCQQKKDLRQTLQLKKWYGYGDGLEVWQETKLATGEVYEVPAWEERFAMEKEVKRIGDGLVKVREDTVKHGGVSGQAISCVGMVLVEAKARSQAIDETNVKEREAKAAKERGAAQAAEENESPLALEAKDEATNSSSWGDVIKPNLEHHATQTTLQDKGKRREIFDLISSTPQTPEHAVKAEREGALITNQLQAGEKVEIQRTGSIDLIAANASPSELARLAQRGLPIVKLPETTAAAASLSLPDHLRMQFSYRYGSTEPTSPTAKEEEPSAVEKRAAVVLDDGAWDIGPLVTKSTSLPAPSGNGLLDLLTGAAIPGGKPAKLTEQPMKRHEEIMAEDENRRLKGVKWLDELVENMLSETKLDPPDAAQKMTSPTSRRPAPVKQPSQQESRRFMWGRWGNYPLPGAAGALDGSAFVPSQFMVPSPAPSIPPPEAIARLSSVTSSAAQLMSPSAFHAARQEKRVCVSAAKPGEETSTQTIEALNLDDGDEDDHDGTGDDSQDYVSAEEGDDNPWGDGDDAQPQSEEFQALEIDDSSRPTLQRKLSSTSGLRVAAPVPENTYRPSPLDDWYFDFPSCKSQRDVISPGPFSSAASTSSAPMFGDRVTPARHHHRSSAHGHRRLSQDNNQFTHPFGYRVATPNNTPDSPPPLRCDPFSPTRIRPSNSERCTITRMSSPTETTSQYSKAWEQMDTPEQSEPQVQAQHERPYFVVNRSANVIDEAANLIEYSTARVMSGGVKIGGLLPRGVNGVVEEDEDAAELDVDFETSAPALPFAVPAIPATTSPPLGHQMTIPTYPLGVPVPGHPQAMSSTYLVPTSMALGHQPQAAAAPNPHHVAHLSLDASAAHVQKPPPLVFNAHGLHHAPHLSLPSQSHVPPVEYCGDFRTTGRCRFGIRCRYSHDIEPRVRITTFAAASRYWPSTAPSPPEPAVSLQATTVGTPPMSPGYQISSILPQPHRIPGMTLSQQPASPFVVAHPSSVAHPRTSPASTAAANRGVKMSNTEKATRILRSLGITPQQLLAHQPAPTVMADGEIMYDLTQGRSNQGTFLGDDPAIPFPTGLKLDRSMKEARDMVLMRFGTEQEKRAVRESSAGMVIGGEKDDVWTVSKGRKSQIPCELGSSGEGQERRGSRPAERDQLTPSHHYSHPQHYQQIEEQNNRQSSQYYHQMDQDTRHPVLAPYSPVQHLQYPNPKLYQAPSHALYSNYNALAQYQHPMQMAAQYQHPVPMTATVTPVTTTNPVPTAFATGRILTQEELIKILTALRLRVPGLTTTPAHPTPPTASQIPYNSAPCVRPPSSHGAQPPQHLGYSPGPYNCMHPSMQH